MAVDLKDRGAEAGGEELDPAQQHYDDVFNNLTSQEHMAKDGVPGDTGAADAEKQSLFNPDGDTANNSSSAASSTTNEAGESTPGGGGIGAVTNRLGPGGVNKLASMFWAKQNRRRTTVAGTLIGLALGGGILGSSILSGPVGFMQIAHTIEQTHLSSNEDAGSSRLMQIYRFIKYNKTGELHRTRMGKLGNTYADRIEARMQSIGLTSEYSPLGLSKTGLAIDRNAPDYKNKSSDQIKQEVKEKWGVDVVGNDQTGLRVDTKSLGFRQTRSFYRGMLRETGVNLSTSAIEAHVMGERDGVTWHPLKKLDAKVLNAVEEWWVNRTTNIEEGTSAPLEGAQSEPLQDQHGQTDPTAANNANNNASTTQQTIDSASKAGADSIKDPSALSKFSDSLNGTLGKTVGLTSLGTGLACMARSIAEKAPAIKEAQVNKPLIRMGMEGVIVGTQMVFGGGDIEPAELQKLSQQWFSSKNHTSWADGQTVQAAAGQKVDGTVPNDTLKSIGSGSPFDAFNTDLLSPICSTGGQLALGIIGFFGAPVSAAASAIIAGIATPKIVDALAHWAAGKAIDPHPQGAEYGNDVMYGGLLASNQQALTMGGVQLSSADTATLTAYESSAQKTDFEHQSLAYRLFSPTDIHSLAGSMLSHEAPSISYNLASMASAFTGLGHTMASLPGTLFSGLAHAGTPTAYDYGIPKYGFSIDEMSQASASGSVLENPFKNGDHVADILDVSCSTSSPCGQDYIDEAHKCFGVDITNTGGSGNSEEWDIQNGSTAIDTFSQDYKDARCDHPDKLSTADWLSVRMFVLDSQTMKSEACYDGDSQSCSDEGMGGSAASSTTAGASSVNGYANPLREVKNLAPGRIDEGVDYSGEGPVYAIGNGKVVHSTSSDCGWPACNWISYTLTDGPAAGKTVYMAENCTPAVTDGQTVTSTTVICHMHDASPNIETGWSSPSADVALAASVYHEGAVTAYGVNFNDLMKKLGAPDGTGDKSSAVGSLPAGWPTTW